MGVDFFLRAQVHDASIRTDFTRCHVCRWTALQEQPARRCPCLESDAARCTECSGEVLQAPRYGKLSDAEAARIGCGLV
jgi:hypothetical protein